MHTASTVRKLTDQFASNTTPMTPGKVTAGRWVVAGMGLIVVVAGVYMAWLTLSPPGQHFARTHDRYLRRQPDQKLTQRQKAVLWVFGLRCAALFIAGGLILIVIAFVIDPES